MLCLPSKKSAVVALVEATLNHMADVVTRVSWVELHGLEPLMLFQYCASPFPNSTQFAFPAQFPTVLGHWNRMPIGKSHVAALQICKELVGIGTLLSTGRFSTAREGWGRFFNPFI